MVMRTRKLSIGGMHCQGCGTVIEQAVAALPGVRKAKVDYTAAELRVTFDLSRTDPVRIAAAVEKHGYRCSRVSRKASLAGKLGNLLVVFIALAGMVWLLIAGDSLADRFDLPRFERGMSYGLLFLVGLLTGFHCIGMCGGFVVGYTTRGATAGIRRTLWPHLAYGFGKLLSYGLMGGAFGALGSVIALTPEIRGYAAVAAGAFLVLFGINMLDWFPILHRFSLPMPRFLRRAVGGAARNHRSPFFIGLLNGLMIACGPLQAMYVMAAGTGSFREGATLLAIFGLGTLPLMFGFGLLTGAVSVRITQGLLKTSAVLVVGLGLIMLNRGLVLGGSGYDFRSLSARVGAEWARLRENVRLPAFADRQTIRMAATAQGYVPDQFVLKQGVPVLWIIDGEEVTQCNRRIVVPSLHLEIDIEPGENRVEFTPTAAGVIPWSCWMGMLQGRFVVEPAAGSPK